MAKLFVIMGKSSTGKDTVYKELLKSGSLKPIVMYTTRPMREGETDGKEYFFTTDKDVEAGNLTAEEGYYYLTFNIKELTYTVQLVNFGVIGDATPGGWNEDTDLVYDPADLKLKVDMTLTDGTIKFRANDQWDVPNGDFGAGDSEGKLAPKGNNISVTAGDYQVVVDLSTPDYTYELIAK